MITAEFWQEKSREINTRLGELEEKIKAHDTANGKYFDQGIRLLELAKSACDQWVKQDSFEKAKLLKMLCSNLIFDEGRIVPTYRNPFDLIAKASAIEEEEKAKTGRKLSPRSFWWATEDSNLKPAD